LLSLLLTISFSFDHPSKFAGVQVQRAGITFGLCMHSFGIQGRPVQSGLHIDFPQSIQMNAAIYIDIGHVRFLTYPSSFIIHIHPTVSHSALCVLSS
jgi:hypothetical protein